MTEQPHGPKPPLSKPPRALTKDQALQIISADLGPAAKILRSTRDTLSVLGLSTLNVEIAIDGLDRASKTIAKAARGDRA